MAYCTISPWSTPITWRTDCRLYITLISQISTLRQMTSACVCVRARVRTYSACVYGLFSFPTIFFQMKAVDCKHCHLMHVWFPHSLYTCTTCHHWRLIKQNFPNKGPLPSRTEKSLSHFAQYGFFVVFIWSGNWLQTTSDHYHYSSMINWQILARLIQVHRPQHF